MKIMKVDVGQVNDSYFANVIAGGMFSDISFQVTKAEKERFRDSNQRALLCRATDIS